jgi:hypothetical protein
MTCRTYALLAELEVLVVGHEFMVSVLSFSFIRKKPIL